jgi:hypothetical protein
MFLTSYADAGLRIFSYSTSKPNLLDNKLLYGGGLASTS